MLQTLTFFSLLYAPAACRHHGAMQRDSRTSTFARIGRSYPRPLPAGGKPAKRGLPRRYRVTGALIAVLSALGLIGWLLAR